MYGKKVYNTVKIEAIWKQARFATEKQGESSIV